MSRRSVEWLAAKRNNQIFDIQSLTEDYLLGILLETMPGKKIFLQQWFEHRYRRQRLFSKQEKTITQRKPVATREYFPDNFRAAVRQKSRWILGICLQGWRAGWTKSLGTNYFLYRDRKALLTNLIVPLGYLTVIYWCWILIHNRLHPQAGIPPLIEASEMYFNLTLAVLLIFLWRIANRIIATSRIYGLLDGLMAIPRVIVANIINFLATVRAIYCFVKAKINGQTPAWGKTEHAWPSEEQLRNYRRRLGDLLLANRAISAEQLEQALVTQQETGEKLGEILLRTGALWEEDLLKALAAQNRNGRFLEVDPYLQPELREWVPCEVAEKFRVYPVAVEGEALVLACEAGREAVAQAELPAILQRPLVLVSTTAADIAFGLRRGYGESCGASNGPQKERLGARLVRTGMISQDALTRGLRQQKRNNRRLGEILVEMGLLSPADLQQHLDEMAI